MTNEALGKTLKILKVGIKAELLLLAMSIICLSVSTIAFPAAITEFVILEVE